MKKMFKYPFILLVSISLLITLIMFTFLFILNRLPTTETLGMLSSGIVTGFCVILFGLSLLYIFTGVIAYIVGAVRKVKAKETKVFARKMLVSGITGVVVSFVLFFVLSIVLSYLGYSLVDISRPGHLGY
jgi:hypothetical protein